MDNKITMITKEIKKEMAMGGLNKIRLGELLVQAREELGDKLYKAYIRENFDFSSKSAEEYVLLFTTYGTENRWKTLGNGKLLILAQEIGDIKKIEQFISANSKDIKGMKRKELIKAIGEFEFTDEEVIVEDDNVAENEDMGRTEVSTTMTNEDYEALLKRKYTEKDNSEFDVADDFDTIKEDCEDFITNLNDRLFRMEKVAEKMQGDKEAVSQFSAIMRDFTSRIEQVIDEVSKDTENEDMERIEVSATKVSDKMAMCQRALSGYELCDKLNEEFIKLGTGLRADMVCEWDEDEEDFQEDIFLYADEFVCDIGLTNSCIYVPKTKQILMGEETLTAEGIEQNIRKYYDNEINENSIYILDYYGVSVDAEVRLDIERIDTPIYDYMWEIFKDEDMCEEKELDDDNYYFITTVNYGSFILPSYRYFDYLRKDNDQVPLYTQLTREQVMEMAEENQESIEVETTVEQPQVSIKENLDELLRKVQEEKQKLRNDLISGKFSDDNYKFTLEEKIEELEIPTLYFIFSLYKGEDFIDSISINFVDATLLEEDEYAYKIVERKIKDEYEKEIVYSSIVRNKEKLIARAKEYNKVYLENMNDYYKNHTPSSTSSKDLTEDEVEIAKDIRKHLIKQYHPDRNNGDNSYMQVVNKMFELLDI